MTDSISRRTILLRGVQLPLAGALLAGLGGCGAGSKTASSASSASGAAAGKSCVDPATMSDAEHSTRDSIGYVEASPDPKQVCAGCAFFHPAAQGSDCGTCDMLTGGAVNSHGHCNSWNAKA